MLDLKEINEEIKRLEECDTTYATCSKLATLYIVRDHYKGAGMAVKETPTEPARTIPAPAKAI